MNLQTLRRFDLNSLVTLKVLLETQHVTQAAEQLNLTQSAVSRSLSKLRRQVGDPILVRSGKGLVATKTAELLLPKLNMVLEEISNLLDPEEFNPYQFGGTIRLATTDYGTHALLPRLIPALQLIAPDLKIITVDWRSSMLTELEENRVDLMIGGVIAPPPNIYQRTVSTDTFRVVMRKSHPETKSMSLDQYLLQKHIIISSNGVGQSRVDTKLQELGLKRKVAVAVPHFFAALEIISATDYVALLPSHFIRRYVDPERFFSAEAPMDFGNLDIAMFWHARTHHDPANKWFRQFIVDELYTKRSP